MDEFTVLGRLLRKTVPAIATGLDHTFCLASRIKFTPKSLKSGVVGASGVPAGANVEQNLPPLRVAQPTSFQAESATGGPVNHPRARPSLVDSTTNAYGSAAVTADVVKDIEPDDLDWAGSLSHAAVASLHLSCVVDMVRTGWLAPDESRSFEVTDALEAIEAFQRRTVNALAPLISAMTDDQQAEFFCDFERELPPDLSALEEGL